MDACRARRDGTTSDSCRDTWWRMPREAVDLAVAAGGRLDGHGPAHPLGGDRNRHLLARNPAARRSLTDGLALGKRRGKGQPPLLAVQSGQRRSSPIPSSITAREASPSGGSDRTAPDPLFRSPWSMQVGTKCSTYACKMRTEPS